MQDALVNLRAGSDLEAVYREHGDRLWRALVAFSGDREIASDAVAEAFAQALRRGDALRSPGAWVWRAAYRIAAGELKERGRSAGSATRDGVSSEAPFDEASARAATLLAALRHLSPMQRAAVILHHYAGHPVKEVAAIVGSTGPAVRVHLSRGRRRLRELLEDHDD